MTIAVSQGLRAIVPVLALALAAPVLAQGQPSAADLPLWELGAVGFGVSQQAYPGASEQVRRALVLPFAIYRGKYLRADRDTVGVRVVNQERFELDVGFAGAFGSRASETEARRGMPELGTLIEFGPRLKWNLGAAPADGRLRAEVALRGVFDLSDSLRYKGLSLEPRMVYERRGDGGWRYGANVGPLLGNARLADTFYGVAPAYALPDRRAYVAQSGLIAWRLGVSATRELTPDLRLFLFARVDSVAGAANRDSPLVRQKNGGSVGVGLSYTFARSSQRAND
ncbi:MAG: MipA/OmpV family protein [Caulobacter sp.]|nr:MipA/OmpV family protein [Vitreoscilla sp.]